MSETIYVWDRFVRFFHWSLVLLFVTSYLSGEEEHWIHVYSGYGIIGLVTLRILWGFIGSEYARFANFLCSPVKAVDYLKRLLTGRKPQRYIGHNPAGGMMVFAMLATLAVVGFSGLQLYALEEGKGPFADHRVGIVHQAYADSGREEHRDRHDHERGSGDDHEEDEDAEDFWEEIHEIAVNVMILLVVLEVVVLLVVVLARDFLLRLGCGASSFFTVGVSVYLLGALLKGGIKKSVLVPCFMLFISGETKQKRKFSSIYTKDTQEKLNYRYTKEKAKLPYLMAHKMQLFSKKKVSGHEPAIL